MPNTENSAGSRNTVIASIPAAPPVRTCIEWARKTPSSLRRYSATADLFAGRRQLIVYRAFIEPGTEGWPEHGCRGCSMVADHIPNLAHLNARDTTLVFVSRAMQADLERIKARMGWQMPWYTITDNFDAAFGVDEWHGTNAFIRDGDRVFRTYFINNRGDEAFENTWNYLDMTALGRQETWEDSPEGYPQSPPYEWWNWNDEYGQQEPSRWFGDPDPDDPNDPRPPRVIA